MARFTETDLDMAMGRLGSCQFFPKDPDERSAVRELLVDMVPSCEALVWLTKTFRDRIGKWHGPAELRGVLCWKYPPLDGQSWDSTLPGFSTRDAENIAIEQHEQRKIGWIDSEGRPSLPAGDGGGIVRRLAAAKGML